MRVASACSGYGGLELGLSLVTDVEVVWQAEIDKHASKILAVRFAGVPNLGDIKTVDWTQVEPVDLFTAGFPCQDLSYAGRGAGIAEGTRSGLWFDVAHAIGVLRPRWVLLENVAAIVTRRPGLDVVLADLAALGFDATWVCVRASDAGACHSRNRWFCLASDARRERHGCGEDRRGLGLLESGDAGEASQREWSWPVVGDRSATAVADTASDGRHEGRPESARLIGRSDAAQCGPASTDAERLGRDGRPCREGWRSQRRVAPERGSESSVQWGAYRPAIERWERTLGRVAPRPTELATKGGQRLSPRFVEFMMGLPEGWVTDIDIPRNAQLAALGNGCVPQQVALAVRTLFEIEARERAA